MRRNYLENCLRLPFLTLLLWLSKGILSSAAGPTVAMPPDTSPVHAADPLRMHWVKYGGAVMRIGAQSPYLIRYFGRSLSTICHLKIFRITGACWITQGLPRMPSKPNLCLEQGHVQHVLVLLPCLVCSGHT